MEKNNKSAPEVHTTDARKRDFCYNRDRSELERKAIQIIKRLSDVQIKEIMEELK